MRSQWFQDEPARRFSIPPLRTWSATNLLLLLLVVVFLLLLTPLQLSAYLSLRTESLGNPLNWYQFVTYALLHSETTLWHLVLNCLGIWFFGPRVEEALGGKRPFFGFCAAAAVIAGLSFVLLDLARGVSGSALVGASGIVFAILVAFATLYPNAQVILFIFPVRAWVLVTILLLVALFSELRGGDTVAHVAHLGGGAFGFAFIRYRHLLESGWRRYRGRRREAERKRQQDRRQEIDRLLDKINRAGISSLTRSERRFLDSASRDLRDRG